MAGVTAIDLLKTPTFRTPAFLTPELGFDETHNVFESAFKEGNARFTASKGPDAVLDVKSAVVHVRPIGSAYVVSAIVYGLLYMLALLLASIVIFRRRDFK